MGCVEWHGRRGDDHLVGDNSAVRALDDVLPRVHSSSRQGHRFRVGPAGRIVLRTSPDNRPSDSSRGSYARLPGKASQAALVARWGVKATRVPLGPPVFAETRPSFQDDEVDAALAQVVARGKSGLTA